MQTIETKVTLDLFDCTECGAHIALTENLERNLRDTHRNFYCPNGHAQHFPAKSDAEKLRISLNAAELEKTRLTRIIEAERVAAAAALADVQAKARQRVVAGSCPCCKRTFKQLAAHMKTKHPNYAKE